LKNRFPRASSNHLRMTDGAVRGDVAHPKFASIPGHVRMVPGEPDQTGVIRTDPWRGIEVIPGDQNLRFASVHGQPNQSVHRFTVICTVIFADTDQAIPARINYKVCIAKLRVGTALANQLRFCLRRLPV